VFPKEAIVAQLWHDLIPTLVGGLGGVLGVFFAEAYLVGPDSLGRRLFRRG
jgi:hypothetical protein